MLMSSVSEISLRDLVETDVEDMMHWAGDDQVTKSLAWETYKSQDDTLQFIRTFAAPHPWFKAICLNDIAIGSLTLTPGTGIHCCRAELGYVLARKHWGKGIMTRAVKLAVSTGFKDLKVARVEAIVDKENIASQKVLLKAGFENTGLQRSYILMKGKVKDCYIFAMVSQDDEL